MRTFASFQLLCLVSGVLFVACESFASKEVWALTTFKEAIYEDPHLVLSNWNSLDGDPCGWTGITCSLSRDHVLKINISGSSIRGFLVPDLGQLSFLQELILHGNKLLGIIPKDLGLLKYLRILDLGMNELTGPIPPELGNLTSVVKINLQSNGLSGRLPPELGNLAYLEELHLDRNKLRGTLPANSYTKLPSNLHGMYASNSNLTGLCRSSQLKVADFSFNFFVGNIPKCLEYLPRSSFQGNCLQKEDPKQRPVELCAGAPPSKGHPGVNPKNKPAKDVPKHQETSKPAWLLALEIVTGTMVCSLFLVAVFTALQRCNSKSSIIIPWKKSASEKDHIAVYIDSEMLKDVVRFNRQELEVACEDFSNIIGSSPDSLVYKGTMKGGPEIAVISLCIKEEHWTGYLELYFQREVTDLARLNHENAAKLLGYCSESTPFTRMLVFEYASNGTLYEHLHYGEGCQLSWTRRMKIVIGIARGLKYFHTELEPPFTISELNSSAVYLTEDFLPKLVDFESWKTILARSEKNSGSISSQGAICVLPNSMEARHLDVKGNVYAFGILLLEIISGRPPYCKDKGCLIEWAKDYLELPDVMPYVVDPELKHFSYDDLKVLCDVVNLCTHPEPTKRRALRDGALEGEHAPALTIKDSIATPLGFDAFCHVLSQLSTNISAEKSQSRALVLVAFSRSPSYYVDLLKRRGLDISSSQQWIRILDCYTDPLGWRERLMECGSAKNLSYEASNVASTCRNVKDVDKLFSSVISLGKGLVGQGKVRFSVAIDSVNEMLRHASLSSVAGLLSNLRCCDQISSIFWFLHADLCEEKVTAVIEYMSSMVASIEPLIPFANRHRGNSENLSLVERNFTKGKFHVRCKRRNGRVRVMFEEIHIGQSGIDFTSPSSEDGLVNQVNQGLLPKVQFNLQLSEKERNDRAKVVLPFEHQGNGKPVEIYDGRKSLLDSKNEAAPVSTGNSKINDDSSKGEIIYFRDSDDEMPDSDEDPDDDLDI